MSEDTKEEKHEYSFKVKVLVTNPNKDIVHQAISSAIRKLFEDISTVTGKQQEWVVTDERAEMLTLVTNIQENTEDLSTTEGDDVPCISVENLEGLLKRYDGEFAGVYEILKQ